jgi:hypothetical protein
MGKLYYNESTKQYRYGRATLASQDTSIAKSKAQMEMQGLIMDTAVYNDLKTKGNLSEGEQKFMNDFPQKLAQYNLKLDNSGQWVDISKK